MIAIGISMECCPIVTLRVEKGVYLRLSPCSRSSFEPDHSENNQHLPMCIFLYLCMENFISWHAVKRKRFFLGAVSVMTALETNIQFSKWTFPHNQSGAVKEAVPLMLNGPDGIAKYKFNWLIVGVLESIGGEGPRMGFAIFTCQLDIPGWLMMLTPSYENSESLSLLSSCFSYIHSHSFSPYCTTFILKFSPPAYPHCL